MLKLAKESAYDEIKRKWIKACHSVGGGFVRGQTSAKDSDDHSSAGQLELGWALRRARKSVAFSEKELFNRCVLDRRGNRQEGKQFQSGRSL